MLSIKERIEKIDEAIDYVLSNLGDGILIKRYQIDGVVIEKNSPFELIKGLRAMKRQIISEANKKRLKRFRYVF